MPASARSSWKGTRSGSERFRRSRNGHSQPLSRVRATPCFQEIPLRHSPFSAARSAITAIVTGAALALATGPVFAQQAPATTVPLPRERPTMGQFSAQQLQALDAVNSYFNGLRRLRGEFLQIGPERDQLTEGVFYLERPGRVRFEYYPPSRLLIVSNGTVLEIRNDEARTVDRYPLNRTPLAPLLANNTDLTDEANVRDVMIEEDTIAVVLTESEEGTWLTLYFDRLTYELKQWVTLDAQGNTVTFVIYNLSVNQPIDETLFGIVRDN